MTNDGVSDLDWSKGGWTFRCPKCGSSFFRTEGAEGQCKGAWMPPGSNYAGCAYRWRRCEDSKVFVRVKKVPT